MSRTPGTTARGVLCLRLIKGLPASVFPVQNGRRLKIWKAGVERTITDATLPGGPLQKTIVCEAPFDRCDREKDYETVWAEFEKRFDEEVS